ncbi:hypothetical protein KX729_06980 [Rhizobium sp. XQZ8]|uniref:hypothetical protein n=1 Tax=Rhizobium populisoli TaxID=2859785 RepID=UPI001CA55FAC|nr:hypothetical protein [Rhizobium populisoli]MBW6421182.1 hypothetical protein [Rhizobium populisoli]
MAGILIPIVCYAIIVAIVGRLSWSIWKQRRNRNKPEWPPYPVVDATDEEMDRRHAELRDGLSRKALGAERARRLWHKLAEAEIGEGLIHQSHRDFCGHGLIRTQDGVILCDIQDGSYPGTPIATWTTEAEFIDFFSRQSDFSMSGWDLGEPVFFTDDGWYRNNQRLTAAIVDKFLRT